MNMDGNGTSKEFNAEVLRKVARIIDSIIFLVRLINEHITRLCRSLESLPEEFTIWDIAKVMNDAMDSITTSTSLIANIAPSSKLCGEERSRDFWNLHAALIIYHLEALMLLKHSLLSAFTGYYSAASIELRSAMESVVRGVVFDLLAIPEYRKNVKELQKIKGFRGAKSFPELIELLEKRLGDKRSKVSVEIFDMIDKELEEFNPESAFTKLLLQLKDWGVIDDKLLEDIDSYYAELSRLVHRAHPRSSEVDIRVAAKRDLLDLEPVPEELFTYLHWFADLNGLFTYLVLKVFSIDLVQEDFKRCIDWSELSQDMQVASKLAETYDFWKRVIEVLEQLKAS